MLKRRALTADEVRRLFPHASRSVLAVAAAADGAGGGAVVECGDADAPGGAASADGAAAGGFLVRVTSVRRRLLDEDNLCVKALVDCCRYAGLIPGDAPRTTRIEARQRQCGKGEEEGTVIEIFELATEDTEGTEEGAAADSQGRRRGAERPTSNAQLPTSKGGKKE